jgi:hypothetical protein
MLPEGRWTHVRAIRQIISLQRLREMLLEPGDDLRNLLAGRPGHDEVTELRTVGTGQQTDSDFLLDQRRQPRHQGRLVEEVDEPNERIEQRRVQCFERDRSMRVISPGPRRVHLGRHLQDGTDIERQHNSKKWFAHTGSRDVRDDREIDGRQHGLARAVVDRLAAEQHLLVALRDDAEAQVVNAMQRLGGRVAAMERERRNDRRVVAVGLGKAFDGASQAVIAVAFEVYAPACLGMSNLQRVSVSDDSSIRPRCAFSFPLRNVILGNELDGFGKRFRGDPATVESP